MPSGQKLPLVLLATITLKVVPSARMHHYQCFCHFLNAFCKSCSVRVFSTACDSVSITSMFENDRKQRKVTGDQVRWVGWVGTTVMLFLVKNSLLEKEVWDGALSWCNSQFFCRQSSWWSLRTFSRSCRRMSQQYVELTVRPARTNSVWTIPLIVKENDEHTRDLVLHLAHLSRSALNWACHSNTRVWLMLS
jgi:hypothetical protein